MTAPLTDKIAQLEYVIREQMTEIDQLRATVGQKDQELDGLVAWIAGDADAHAALRAIYADPRSSPANKIKAAIGSIGYEIAKPASVNVVVDFKARVQAARSRTLELRKQEWSRQDQLELDAPTPPTILGGDHEGDALGPEPAA
jgi:hypothetical protein